MRWIIIAVAVVAGLGLWFWFEHRPSAPVYWQGYAEGDYLKIAPTQSGLLTDVAVKRGDAVAQGASLFKQDDTSDRAARDQAGRQLAQAQAQLADLQAAGKPTEIQQAQANLADAQAARAQAQGDLQRAQALLPQGAATQQNVDQLRAAFLSDDAKVQVAEAALAQAQAPQGRDEAIKAQTAAVQAAQAAVDISQWRLDQRSVTAPAAGRIADVIALPGETVNAGMPVVSLLPPQNIFVRFFVPEPDLAATRFGSMVTLACDGCADGLTATISFISTQAEYTPPVIYSESTSAKLVYLVEARMPPDEAQKFNPGQPIEVRPMAGGAQP